MRRSGHALALVFALAACGGPAPRPKQATASPRPRALRSSGHPAVIVLARDGDPLSGAAIVIDTGAVRSPGASAVALAAVLRGRLGAEANVRVVAQGASVRIDALLSDEAAFLSWVERARVALVSPIDEAAFASARAVMEHAGVTTDDATAAIAACRAEPVVELRLSREALEQARAEVSSAQSVAIALVGAGSYVTSGAEVLAQHPRWPEQRRVACPVGKPSPLAVYPTQNGGTTRVDILAHRPPAVALGAARALGDSRAALLAKLTDADASARVVRISGSALPSRACIDLSIELPTREPGRIAKVTALALSEIAAETARLTPVTLSDPRDEASLLAASELDAACDASASEQIVVGVPQNGDSSPRAEPFDADRFKNALDSALSHQSQAWRTPAVAVEKLVEAGQPEAYVLLASSCGTRAEGGPALGATLAALALLSRHARETYGIDAEPFVSFDGAGLLAHARARDGESAVALGTRLAESTARALLEDPLPAGEAPVVAPPDRALALLAATLAPAHETWVDPRMGFALRPPRNAVIARLEGVRKGPLRAVVMANSHPAQADAMARGIDRFASRDEARTCPAELLSAPVKAGTYFAEQGGSSVAYLALPVPTEPACASASVLAAAMRETWLPRALAGVARASDAQLLALPTGRYLAVRIEAPGAALDASVSQARAMFERLRQGALPPADVALASLAIDRERVVERLDPRARATAAWRNAAPTTAARLDDLKTCSAAMLRDEALIIATVRGHVSIP